MRGTCVWFRGSFGFIAPDAGGDDIFCHWKGIALSHKGEHRALDSGDIVEYDVENNAKSGRPVAINVRRIEG